MAIEDQSTVDQYYILASSVVFLYDFALTMPQEIEFLWSSKLKLVNVLVIALRYITVLGCIPVLMLTFVPETADGEGSLLETIWFVTTSLFVVFPLTFDCSFRMPNAGKIPGILGVICQALTLTFLAIRLFAIYDKKRWILYTTVPFALLSIGLSSLSIAYSFNDTVGEKSDREGVGLTLQSCFTGPFFEPEQLSDKLYKFSYIANIFLDTLIFILAATKTAKMYSKNKIRSSYSSLASILLRDGSILYAILAISNITNFVFFMVSLERIDARINPYSLLFVVSSGTNSEMTHALSAILVSRMVFNLREVGTELQESTSEWRSRIEGRSLRQPNVHRLRAKNGGHEFEDEDEYDLDTFES
ncbi:hypothetical protein SCHPADRAFT_938080 [Schizopora paradoxa]|uniref:DUF6533 domain-containing protein n=1 Tax=Schizopora paradoxa TaxID=27342 RepID=A0A0H2S345_9AGAM|nr:hypothetical protein SCHPADRAFT_938080 [Schizopora paradoxa]